VLIRDGEPVLGESGKQLVIDYEWDLVYAADPARALATIKAKTRDRWPEPEDVRQRHMLQESIVSAFDAARALARMHHKRGTEVFGPADAVDALREQLKQVEMILVRFGPSQAWLFADEDQEGEA
jgi:hypothetical protein